MTGRERFRLALDGRAIAFAPIAWERLDELVHQPDSGWWRWPSTAQRLIADVAALARADAVVVLAAAQAADAVRASGATGDDALDELAHAADVRSGFELVARLQGSESFAVIAGLPDVAWLQERFDAAEPEAAEDALSDLARGYLDAGADALAVIGTDTDPVRAAAGRAAAAGDYYGRPVLAVAGGEAWIESGGTTPVAILSDAGDWPALEAGLVLTPGDVSAHWNTARLHSIALTRPQ